MKSIEVNFDGLVGPTHNYSGLSYGNIASLKSSESASNPRLAALQGLEKMKFLLDQGVKQAVLPPHERPYIPILRTLGFEGSEKQILKQVFLSEPTLLYACSSAASMWTANAATISPSTDTRDGKLHITPANLSSKFHRSLEASFTEKILQKIFHRQDLFTVHPALPQGLYFSDEGAANHSRFCEDHSKQGIELFVWGHSVFHEGAKPKCFPARQTLEASQAIARRHMLNPNKVVFAQQNPAAIDAGVFHNDVISVSNEYVYLYHEKSFLNTSQVVQELKNKLPRLILLEVPEKRIPLKEAVETYLFNSQIIALPNHTMRIIAPSECLHSSTVNHFLTELVEDKKNPVGGIDYLDLHQSMSNGGGPACLRLRIVLTEQQIQAIHPGIILDEELYEKLKTWIHKHYRDHLLPKDLASSEFYLEVQAALDALTCILDLGSIYSFQKA